MCHPILFLGTMPALDRYVSLRDVCFTRRRRRSKVVPGCQTLKVPTELGQCGKMILNIFS